MTSTSPSTPSEGEILESDLEKAKPSNVDVHDTSVDRHSRKLASTSRSPSPAFPTRQFRSQTRSRSPYRESRGTKRSRDNSYPDRSKDDPRRFKVRYENRPFEDRRRPRGRYEDLDRHRDSSYSLRYDDRGINDRPKDHNQRSRSRSPRSSRRVIAQENDQNGRRGARADGRDFPDRGRKGHREGNSRLPKQQSVSDRGHSSVATARDRRKAEIAGTQEQHEAEPGSNYTSTTAEYVCPRSFSQCLIV